MRIQNKKIIEATEAELYDYYLTRGWDDLYSFFEYKQLCAEQGTKIIEEGGAE